MGKIYFLWKILGQYPLKYKVPPSLIVQKKRQKNVIVGQLTGGRALHPMSNVMRIYIKQKYGGQGLINMEECCVAES